MKGVYQVLRIKEIMVKDVVTANPETSTEKIIEMIYKKHIGSIVIVDDEEKCVGIFSERDVIRIVAQKASLTQPIKNVMTTNVITIWEGATFKEARNTMVTHGIRHLPVINDQKKLVGILPIRGILDEIFGVTNS